MQDSARSETTGKVEGMELDDGLPAWYACALCLAVMRRSLDETRLPFLEALIFTIPYGILADKIGRKPVAVMSLCGVLATQLWVSFVSEFTHTWAVESC